MFPGVSVSNRGAGAPATTAAERGLEVVEQPGEARPFRDYRRPGPMKVTTGPAAITRTFRYSRYLGRILRTSIEQTCAPTSHVLTVEDPHSWIASLASAFSTQGLPRTFTRFLPHLCLPNGRHDGSRSLVLMSTSRAAITAVSLRCRLTPLMRHVVGSIFLGFCGTFARFRQSSFRSVVGTCMMACLILTTP